MPQFKSLNLCSLLAVGLSLSALSSSAMASFWQTKLEPYIEWFELEPTPSGSLAYANDPANWRMNLGLALNRDHLYYGYNLSSFYFEGKDSDPEPNGDSFRDFRFQAFAYKKHDLVPGLKVLAGARFRQTWLSDSLRLSDAYDFFVGGQVDYSLSESWKTETFATIGVADEFDELNYRLEGKLKRRINDQSSIGLSVKYGKLHFGDLPTVYHSIAVLYHTSL